MIPDDVAQDSHVDAKLDVITDRQCVAEGCDDGVATRVVYVLCKIRERVVVAYEAGRGADDPEYTKDDRAALNGNDLRFWFKRRVLKKKKKRLPKRYSSNTCRSPWRGHRRNPQRYSKW